MTRALIVTLLAASPACSPTAPDEAVELSVGMARWETVRPAAYELVLERTGCECLPEWLIPVRVTVQGHQVTSVVNEQTGEPVVTEIYHAMSVDELFDVIEDAIVRDADTLEVTYDRQLGYPTSISIDYDRNVADDELLITAHSLEPLE
jgi:hypothetical protein